MAPIRSVASFRRRSSLNSLLHHRRKSLAPPKAYTFAPNVTPGTYPTENEDDKESNSSSTPAPEGEQLEPSLPQQLPPSTARRRRAAHRMSVSHIPRPPNAFMLFRQNFVHQKHVPGSIETTHASLSRIVGDHWKQLPSAEKKRWEDLAEMKKEEHKRMYPDYRFRPKHDPEKKRKRQEAKAEKEREERRKADEIRAKTNTEREDKLVSDVLKGHSSSASPRRFEHLQLHHQDRESRPQQRQFNIGHRRSSSVPLPADAYNYPYTFGHTFPNFGFSSQQQGIAIPTLPSSVNGAGSGMWFDQVPVPSHDSHISPLQGQDATNLQLPNHLSHPHTPNSAPVSGQFETTTFAAPTAMPSRPPSPRLARSLRSARVHQMTQLGRRASSTQPSLSHLNTNAHLHLQALYQQSLRRSRGETGADDGDLSFSSFSYPSGVFPVSMIFDSQQEGGELPEVNTSLLNPSFNFSPSLPVNGNVEENTSPMQPPPSAVSAMANQSAPNSAADSDFSMVGRSSFDFSAMQEIFLQSVHLTAPSGSLNQAFDIHGMNASCAPVDVNFSPLENIAPHETFSMQSSSLSGAIQDPRLHQTADVAPTQQESVSSSSKSTSPGGSPHQVPSDGLHVPQAQRAVASEALQTVGGEVRGAEILDSGYTGLPASSRSTGHSSPHASAAKDVDPAEVEVPTTVAVNEPLSASLAASASYDQASAQQHQQALQSYYIGAANAGVPNSGEVAGLGIMESTLGVPTSYDYGYYDTVHAAGAGGYATNTQGMHQHQQMVLGMNMNGAVNEGAVGAHPGSGFDLSEFVHDGEPQYFTATAH